MLLNLKRVKLIRVKCQYLPLHVVPSAASVYPLRHEHTKDPGVFLHVWLQRPRAHSLMSENMHVHGDKSIRNLYGDKIKRHVIIQQIYT